MPTDLVRFVAKFQLVDALTEAEAVGRPAVTVPTSELRLIVDDNTALLSRVAELEARLSPAA